MVSATLVCASLSAWMPIIESRVPAELRRARPPSRNFTPHCGRTPNASRRRGNHHGFTLCRSRLAPSRQPRPRRTLPSQPESAPNFCPTRRAVCKSAALSARTDPPRSTARAIIAAIDSWSPQCRPARAAALCPTRFVLSSLPGPLQVQFARTSVVVETIGACRSAAASPP